MGEGDNKKDVENFSCSLEVGGTSSLAGNRQELKLRVTVRCNLVLPCTVSSFYRTCE